MRTIEFKPPTELFDVPDELIGDMGEQLKLDTPIAYGFPYPEVSMPDFQFFMEDMELGETLAHYACFLGENASQMHDTTILILARKLRAEPGEPFVAANDPRGWHVDLQASIAVTDTEPTTDYLTGEFDCEEAAARVGGLILVNTLPGTNTHRDQIDLLNVYDSVDDMPGELKVVNFKPLKAVLHAPTTAHRRPPKNNLEVPVTRTFVNAMSVGK